MPRVTWGQPVEVSVKIRRGCAELVVIVAALPHWSLAKVKDVLDLGLFCSEFVQLV
jgi:hypothetical protein